MKKEKKKLFHFRSQLHKMVPYEENSFLASVTRSSWRLLQVFAVLHTDGLCSQQFLQRQGLRKKCACLSRGGDLPTKTGCTE